MDAADHGMQAKGTNPMSIAEDLERLANLRDRGVLSEDEFARLRLSLLDEQDIQTGWSEEMLFDTGETRPGPVDDSSVLAEVRGGDSLFIYLPLQQAANALLPILRSGGSLRIRESNGVSVSASGRWGTGATTLVKYKLRLVEPEVGVTFAHFDSWDRGLDTMLAEVTTTLGPANKPAGRPPPPLPSFLAPVQPLEAERWSGMAIAGFVLGLVPVVPFIGSILAIVFGAIGRRQAVEQRMRGAALAAWGIALGILGIIGSVLLVVLIVIAVHNSSDYKGGYSYGQYSAGTGMFSSAQDACGGYSGSFYNGCVDGYDAATG